MSAEIERQSDMHEIVTEEIRYNCTYCYLCLNGCHVQYDAVQCDKGYKNLVPRKSSNVCLKSKKRAAWHLSGFTEAFDMVPHGK